MWVAEIDGRDSSVTFLNGLKLYAGQFSGGEERTALQRRVQIRETIRTHLRRERELYSRGVKVLSLFFIDEVSKIPPVRRGQRQRPQRRVRQNV